MQKDAQGLYQVSFRLPAGVYPYHFLINPRFGEPSTDPRFSWSNMTMADGSQKGLQNLEAALASPARRTTSCPTPKIPR